MEKELKRNIQLGLFVIIGILIFIGGIFLVGSKSQMFKKTFNISAIFSNANGLKKGSKVRFNGVNVGIVKAVNLKNDTTVQVDMQIEEGKHEFITKNAIASIASDGLMGDKLINIVSGLHGGALVVNGDMVQSNNGTNTDKMIETLSASNENIRTITDNLKALTTNLNSGEGSIQSLYNDPNMAKELKQSFHNLNSMSEDVLDAGLSLKQITKKIQSSKGSVGQILNDTSMAKALATTINKLKNTSDKLNSVSSQMGVTMEKVNTGNGTVNTLLTDTALANNLKESIINIKKASAGLDKNMEALKHNVFLRGYFKSEEKKKKKDTE